MREYSSQLLVKMIDKDSAYTRKTLTFSSAEVPLEEGFLALHSTDRFGSSKEDPLAFVKSSQKEAPKNTFTPKILATASQG